MERGYRRIAGVIGGLGPQATVDFLQRVIELTPAGCDQDHVRLLIDQNPSVPNRQHALLDTGESPGPALAAMAAGLQAAGADFLVMPCNTAHAFADDIVAAVTIPFVSIITATISALPAGKRKVGVLETPACRAARLYETGLKAAGKVALLLDDGELDVLMRAAYAVKRNEHGERERRDVRALADALAARGAEALIVACTEVPLLLDAADVPLISSTDALALKTIEWARAEPDAQASTTTGH